LIFAKLVDLQLPRYQRMSNRSTAPTAGARCRIIDQTDAEKKGFGRGGAIRTPDPLRPRQVRYQAALRPDMLIVAALAARAHF
jgi:hypothetical protein